VYNILVKTEPSYFQKARAKIKHPSISSAWKESYISAIRASLREDILSKEQENLCCYCEIKINASRENSNIDHFKTRNLFPDLTLNYKNLFVSCNTNGQCSSYKDSHIKNKIEYDSIINPLIDIPENFFDYLLTGDIFPKENISHSDREKAEFTIQIFQLNCRRLVEIRKIISISLINLKKSGYSHTLEDVFESFPDYKSFVKNIYPKI